MPVQGYIIDYCMLYNVCTYMRSMGLAVEGTHSDLPVTDGKRMCTHLVRLFEVILPTFSAQFLPPNKIGKS